MSSGAAEFGCRTCKKGIFILDIIIIWFSLGFNNKLLACGWEDEWLFWSWNSCAFLVIVGSTAWELCKAGVGWITGMSSILLDCFPISVSSSSLLMGGGRQLGHDLLWVQEYYACARSVPFSVATEQGIAVVLRCFCPLAIWLVPLLALPWWGLASASPVWCAIHISLVLLLEERVHKCSPKS